MDGIRHYVVHCLNDTHCEIEYCGYNLTGNESDFSSNYSLLVDTPANSTYITVFDSLMLMICLIGIVGIIMTVIVLSRKHMCTSTNIYLKSLAIADLGFLVIFSSRLIGNQLSRKEWYIFNIYFEYAQIFLHTFLLTSVWLTVILAVERYIAICHPLRAASICTIWRSRAVVGLTFVASLCCRCLNFFRITINWNYDECTQKKSYFVELTEMGRSKIYKICYAWIVDGIICAILPFLALLALNIRLIVEIYKSSKYLRYQLGIDSKMQTVISAEQLKITIMLVFIVIVFFVCQAPYVVVICYKHLYDFDAQNIPETIYIVIDVTCCLLGLKSSMNFILYCWFSEKFRITFKRMFCWKRCCGSQRQTSRKMEALNSTFHGVTTYITTSTKKSSSHIRTDTL